MTDHYVSLTCLNCSQPLDVYDDMERFFCGKCGAGMLVERRGGTVVLQPREVPAAALRPDRPDVQSLSRKREEMLAQRSQEKKQGFAVGAALMLAGFLLVRLGISYLFGLGTLLAGVVLIGFVRRRDKSVVGDLRVLDAQIDTLQSLGS